MKDLNAVDRNLAMEAVRITEAAAISAVRLMGRGDERAADQAAVDAMHSALNNMIMDGTVRIGEGIEGEAEKLYTGEPVGSGEGPKVDVAIVPLEGKSIVARGGPNALSVIAMAEQGGFLQVPGLYMEKIAVGGGLPDGVVDLDFEPLENVTRLAEAKNCRIKDLVICLLDRPRHAPLIAQIRETGARIQLILDGDVSGIIEAADIDGVVDMYCGIGGASQGVLAAAALRGLGGQMQGRLVLRNPEDAAAAKSLGIDDPDHKYTVQEMAAGHVTFAATGVTYGAILEGVRLTPSGAVTHSLVTRSQTGTLRFIKGHHNFTRRPAGG
ncbi:MAG: class II fructose-bisphosphatase [Rhodospirillales bacterium]|nr:class II fructose-bisphosphatase [Rhodospirillales bacterium]